MANRKVSENFMSKFCQKISQASVLQEQRSWCRRSGQPSTFAFRAVVSKHPRWFGQIVAKGFYDGTGKTTAQYKSALH